MSRPPSLSWTVIVCIYHHVHAITAIPWQQLPRYCQIRVPSKHLVQISDCENKIQFLLQYNVRIHRLNFQQVILMFAQHQDYDIVILKIITTIKCVTLSQNKMKDLIITSINKDINKDIISL